MPTLRINSKDVHYLDNQQDSSQAIIFIHGNSHSSRTFRNQFNDQFLNQYRLIALDLPGHGNSSALSEYSISKFVSTLGSLQDQLELEDIILVGHSLGGHIAIESLEELKPKGILFFGTPPLTIPLDMGGFKENKDLELIFQNELNDSQINQLFANFYTKQILDPIDLEDFKKTDLEFRSKMIQSFANGIYQDEIKMLNSFTGHKACLHGTQDKLVNLPYMQEKITLKDLWQNKIIEIDSSHNLHIEDYNRFNLYLQKFADAVFKFNPNLAIGNIQSEARL